MQGRWRYRELSSGRCVAALGHETRSGIIIGTDESVADCSPRSSGPERTSYTVTARSKVPKTTIIDIAAASGVSVATVSRILNDKPDVADATRKRVLRVMDEIGFAPQSAWRQIRSGRTGLIAVHRPEVFNPPAHRLVLAAALGVEDAGYSINIITRSLSEGELLAIFRSRQADGIILHEISTDDSRPEVLRDHGYPFVMIGHRTDNTGLSFADIDIEHGIGLAMEHLVGLGHRRVGFLTVDPVVEHRVYGFAAWSLRSYQEACARAGLEPITTTGAPTIDAMAAAASQLLDGHPDLTAIIAPQQQSVIGVLKVCYTRGIVVPRDLSVVTVLSDPMSELATPPLTSINFPAEELGRVAAQILVDRLDNGGTEPRQVFLRPELTVRGTTAQR
jgi:DNA-binding LacI/PurR family transcriptional regulator